MRSAHPSPSQQRGLSLIGLLFVSVVLFFVAMLAMKLVPAYIEFFSVKKVLATMGNDPSLLSKSNDEIRRDFERRGHIDRIEAVKPSDLSIVYRGNSRVIFVDYSIRVPLVGNVSLVVDFSASSNSNPAHSRIE
jgi:hypothetical protein